MENIENEFVEFPKIARLCRPVIVTEKIDGTNASVSIVELPEERGGNVLFGNEVAIVGRMAIYAGSRTRWITPKDDNHGFAAWVVKHAEELVTLGPGHHFGEFWGSGIQRGYGLSKGEKRFSLFNTSRWAEDRPACCDVVPVLWFGRFEEMPLADILDKLRKEGSVIAPGFMKPEGVIVFHTAANLCFKKTLEKDELPKSVSEASK